MTYPSKVMLAVLWLTHGVCTLMNSNGRTVTSKMGVTECFDTRLDAQSADARVTIDIRLIFQNSEPTSACQERGNPNFRLSSSIAWRLLRDVF